ncbi:hypothetical protein PspLS_04288 [Pyricularia sp. CBS 133598]|nr:hypothetical protein PspLS_04288 [Pyricularia sp. CBS 133598]
MSSRHLRDSRTGRSSSETLGAGPSRTPVADQTADVNNARPPPLGRLLEEVRVHDLADLAKDLARSAVIKDRSLVYSTTASLDSSVEAYTALRWQWQLRWGQVEQ